MQLQGTQEYGFYFEYKCDCMFPTLNGNNTMNFEEKKKIYKGLTRLQKKELKELSRYFDSKLWSAEPSREKFGVVWRQRDLHKLT